MDSSNIKLYRVGEFIQSLMGLKGGWYTFRKAEGDWGRGEATHAKFF